MWTNWDVKSLDCMEYKLFNYCQNSVNSWAFCYKTVQSPNVPFIVVVYSNQNRPNHMITQSLNLVKRWGILDYIRKACVVSAFCLNAKVAILNELF